MAKVKTINGLFLDPRTWTIDFTSSPFWNPKASGIDIDLHTDARRIPEDGIKAGRKYKFVIATEVWEIPMRKVYTYLRSKGLKVFLIPREPFKTAILQDAMFSYKQFLWNKEYYFKPDIVLAPSQPYADLWKDKTKTIVTGYPRFDYYVKNKFRTKEQIAQEYGLDPKKKWIFFPSFPPYHYKKVKGVDTIVDIYDAREEALLALHSFAKKHKEYQIVVKIHPVSMKVFRKANDNRSVSKLMQEFYNKPSEHMVVVGDNRESGTVAKELLVHSDIVCGFVSTMLLEAGMMDKPVIHMLFGNTKDLGGIPEYAKYIPSATNEKELHDLLANAEPISNPMVKKYIHKVDGLTCERICRRIKKELK